VTDTSSTGPHEAAEPAPIPFETIYRKMAPSVLGYLKAKGVEDPEAITHDVFLAALPRFGSIHGGENGIRTLLFSIAHARSVDHYRRQSRTPVSVPYKAEVDGRWSQSAENEVLSSGANQNVLSILSVLSEDQRDVLLMRVIAELSLADVAGIMNKSIGAIKQLQRRALAALKRDPAARLWRSQ
jgi:RNA polymerase sigma-70 factor (ECF subfamily)